MSEDQHRRNQRYQRKSAKNQQISAHGYQRYQHNGVGYQMNHQKINFVIVLIVYR